MPASEPRASNPEPRSGFVVLVGRPNAGKSTLLNRLVGHTIAVTTAVPLTTHTPLRGVRTTSRGQLIFVDTPGLHRPRHRLGERMMAETREAVHEADIILAVFDGSRRPSDEDALTESVVRQAGKPAVAALNKTDRSTEQSSAAREAEVRASGAFRDIVRVSALRDFGIDRLLDVLLGFLPEGPLLFPPEMITDQPEQYLVRDLIRGQAMRLTREELPHSVAVEVEEFAERPNDLTYIHAVLHVERESQKKVIIGSGGRMLKEIGRRSRAEAERLLGRRVYLDLLVKTAKDWRNRPDLIERFYPR